MEGATKYKVFYDESTLLSKEVPEPLFDTDFIDTNQFDLKDLTPGTEYTLIVR